mgnify:FL=1
MNDLLTIYIKKLQNNNLTRNTIEAYTRDVKRFIDFTEKRNENQETVDNITIMAYSE